MSALMRKYCNMRKPCFEAIHFKASVPWLNGITDSMDMSLSKLREIRRSGKPGMLQSMGSQRIRHNLATEQQQGFEA